MGAHGAADAGTLVEVDKDRQLLFFVQEGRTVWVFNTSTGNGQEYTEEDQNSPGDVINGVSMTPNGVASPWTIPADTARPPVTYTTSPRSMP